MGLIHHMAYKMMPRLYESVDEETGSMVGCADLIIRVTTAVYGHNIYTENSRQR